MRRFPRMVLAAGSLLGACGDPGYDRKTASLTQTGSLIPLYTYPLDASWDRVAAAKRSHPLVPVAAIANPASGVGPRQDVNYTAGIAELRSAGVTVLGYVPTGWGRRRAHQIKAEVKKWRDWYGVDGIFFDQMSNTAGKEGYYADLGRYAKSVGLATTVGNPGADTQDSYISTLDVLVLHDSADWPDLTVLRRRANGYGKERFGALSYSVPVLDPARLAELAACAGYVHLTDDVLPNPWDSLPGYFETLVGLLSPD